MKNWTNGKIIIHAEELRSINQQLVQEVEERKQAEEALRQSEQKLRMLFDNAPLGYQSLDEEGLIIEVNRTWLDILGYAREEVIGRWIGDFLTPAYVEYFQENFPCFKETGEIKDLQFEMVRRDGTIITTSFSGKIAYDPQGRFLRTHCMFQDITARKRIENIMQARLRLLEFANTHSLDELLTTTLDEIEALTGSVIGFYHFLEADQKTLSLQNWSTNTLKNMCTAAGKGSHYDVAQAGVWVDCINARRPVIHNDYAFLPHRKGMPEGHAPVVREVVVPIFRGGLIKAIIGVGNKATNYGGSDIEIVSQLGDISWDIVERKQAEEALRQVNETLRATLDAAPVAIIDLDSEGRVKSLWNPTAEQMLGWRRDEVLGKFLPTVPEESKEEFAGFREWVRSGKSIIGKDAVRQRKDGSLIEYSIYAAPEYDNQGRVIGNIAVLVDITERKQMEQALALKEQEYRTLIENTPDLIVRYDTDLRRIYVNPAWEKSSGLSAGDVINKRAADIPKVPNPIVVEYEEKLRQVLETGTPQAIEFTWVNAFGATLFLEYAIVPEYDRYGKIVSLLAVGRDLTGRKRVEEEIRKLNLELEQRVKDRTAQLEAVNQELEAFAYSVSHDLRAPLRHIDGFLELLQKRTATALDAKSQHYLASVFDSTRRMGTLIDDLLSFSRMGRCEMLKNPVDLKVLAQEVIQEFEPEARGRLIRWQVADLPVVRGDYAMLRIVLVNLISNALKFTRRRPQTEIEIGCLPGRETETIVYIRDNGVGFDMNYADNLFGVFQRLHRVEEYEGTGIGLANVRRIISRHGGRTWAEGKLNQGAAFYFSLP